MHLSPSFIENINRSDAQEAWHAIIERVMEICGEPIPFADAAKEATQRERLVGSIDNLVSSTAWELWNAFPQCIPANSASLVAWWRETRQPKAILILDGLSLRELPWLLEGAAAHGLHVLKAQANASELPAETMCFARALGFANRASLTNNGAGASHFFPLAKTECIDMPWKDASALIDASPNLIFWHQWPDSTLHRGSGQGQGLEGLAKECASVLNGNDFWEFVSHLAQGRSVVITSDHGYAASGLFTDAGEEAGEFLKSQLRSQRYVAGDGETGPFIPPMMLRQENAHGVHRLALGRWKWKSQGGYPTLTHGGMSLLEVLTPWVEVMKTG